jgi:hypothetical protein
LRIAQQRSPHLDVVVKGEDLAAVTVEQRKRVGGVEVLPLQQRVGPHLAHRAAQLVQRPKVVVALQAGLAVALRRRAKREGGSVTGHAVRRLHEARACAEEIARRAAVDVG